MDSPKISTSIANTVVPKPISNLNPTIEAWRGLAAIMVMVCHYRAFWYTGPSYLDITATGVDLFFVLSGFVFAPILITGISSFRAFMVRRIFRMYPLYVLALITYAVLSSQNLGAQWIALAAHLTMLQTSISPTITFFYNPAFWSLPAEWEFYVLMPMLVWVVRRYGFWVCVVIAIAARVAFGFWTQIPTAQSPYFNWASWAVVNLPGILAEFLMGAGVYWAMHLRPQWQRYRNWVAIAFVILLIAALYCYSFVLLPGLAPAWGNLVGVLAAFLFALAVWLSLSLPIRAPIWAQNISLQLGALSYGIYLFHNAAPQMLERAGWTTLSSLQITLASTAISLIIAYALHRAVEVPCRNYGRYLSTKKSAGQIQSS